MQVRQAVVLPPGIHTLRLAGALVAGGCLALADREISGLMYHPPPVKFYIENKKLYYASGDCPEMEGIMIKTIRPIGYVAGWGFADGMDAAIGWNGD
jgi:hypothetical protein